MSRDRLWPGVLVGWTLASLILIALSWSAIVHLWFPDTDDAMRLLEVRDWLAGQSWWDVGQHRLNHGNFPMHWSRLIDLPLAGVMVLLDPLVGSGASTRLAMVLVPLLTLLSVIWLCALLTRRLSSSAVAQRAVLLAPLSVPLVYQMRPMRVDHHGWQVTLALLATLFVVTERSRRSGVAAGLALATLVVVSLEGLPITVAIVAVAMLAALFDSHRRDQALALAWTLLGGVVLLHLATRTPALFAPACDAIAPSWIAALSVATFGASVALLLPRRASLWLRLGVFAVAGIAALVTLRAIAPGCLAGPFATLDPLVYRYWYLNVAEGRPIWDQAPLWALLTIGLPLVGLIGTAAALRAAEREAKATWAMLLVLLAAAVTLSLLVMRSGATANALAVPGAAWLLDAMLTRARAVRSPVARTAATAGALFAATPGLVAAALFGALTPAPAQVASSGGGTPGRPLCDHGHQIADLAVLPPATLFAPLDVSPELLAWTGHRAIAGSYHRNSAAIHTVLAAFLSSPDAARRIVRASGADYVVGCPGENETELYKSAAPNGLWARLERGERFDWLQPVAIANSPVLAWRVVDPARRPLPEGASPP